MALEFYGRALSTTLKSYGILKYMRKLHWKPLALSFFIALSLSFQPQAAPADSLSRSPSTFELSAPLQQLAQLDRRHHESLMEMKKDPARAVLLSSLYPGLGQIYVGNDNVRSFWIMGAGTLVIAGSLIGYALLSNRPEEAAGLGNTLITLSLLGYHLWNIRDAYVTAADYNHYLETQFRISEWLQPFSVGLALHQIPTLNYRFSL